MEWTVVIVITALIGLFFTVGKPVMGVVTELQKLRYETDRQEKEINRDIESIKELTKIAQAHQERLADTERETDKLAKAVAEVVALSAKHDVEIKELRERIEKARARQMESQVNA